MIPQSPQLLFITTLFAIASCFSINPTNLPLPSRTVYQYPNPTWIENISIRSNGNLLLTIFSSHQLFELNPSDGNSTNLIYTFPDVNCVSGITEIEDDVYVIAAGNFSSNSGIPGTWSFWKVDYRCQDPRQGCPPNITKLLDVPQAKTPNGLTTLASDIVLVADAGLNSTWILSVSNLQYGLAIQVPEMSPPATADRDVGVNGIHILDDYLYWTNSEDCTFYRIKIDPSTGKASLYASVEAVANVTTFMDDFTFDGEGHAWIATGTANTLIVVPTSGNRDSTYFTVDGSLTSMSLEGGTSCAFGRGSDDRHILYVVTNGGLISPINGTVVEGGKVVAVDTRGFVLEPSVQLNGFEWFRGNQALADF